MDGQAPLTQLLSDWSEGRRDAADQIFPLLYRELRRIAAARLRSERSGHTLAPTALVNEAYLKLVGGNAQRWENRAHFLTFASHVMRQILTDHARKYRADKRGNGQDALTLLEGAAGLPVRDASLLVLDEALSALEKIEERKARIVELKYFGGLTGEEIAETLQIGVATVTRDLRFAETWLRRYMRGA